jgi:hypothetical protein
MFAGLRIRRVLPRLSVMAIFLLTLAGSVSAQEAPKKPTETPKREQVKLMVENNNYLDVHVYGVRNGYSVSLGMVSGLSKAELKIPDMLTATGEPFEILAHPIGGNLSYQTDPIILGSSKEVVLLVENALSLSSFLLR